MGIKENLKYYFYTRCICPNCYKNIYLGECKIVTPNGDTLPPVGWPCRPGSIDRYSRQFARRCCHECNYMLPEHIEQRPIIRVAIIGDVKSGKSHYLTALIHELKEVSHQYGRYTFRCLTSDTERKFDNICSRPLFDDCREIVATRSVLQTGPMIYELTIPWKGIAVYLIFYDIAGEEFQSLTDYAHFIFDANAFIFTADPVTINHIFSTLPRQLQAQLNALYDGKREQQTPVARFTQITTAIEKDHNRRRDTMPFHSLPMAIMLTKADLLEKVDTMTSTGQLLSKQPLVQEFKQPKARWFWPDYSSGFNLQDIDAAHRNVEDFMEVCQQQGLIQQVRPFKSHKFFAVSATGEHPTNRKYKNVRPYRCLDPIFWILHELT